MNTCLSSSSRAALQPESLASMDDVTQPYIYSFRCSRGMDESLCRLMRERSLNRTSVIRLALYALDCFSRRRDVRGLSLNELVESLEKVAPGSCLNFRDFIRGK